MEGRLEREGKRGSRPAPLTMVFSIQVFLENYFHSRGLKDSTQYAVSLASLYDRKRYDRSSSEFLSAMRLLRTSFFKRNENLHRDTFEKKILDLLDNEFKKKELFSSQRQSRQGLKLLAGA
jgi:hypothetical protein